MQMRGPMKSSGTPPMSVRPPLIRGASGEARLVHVESASDLFPVSSLPSSGSLPVMMPQSHSQPVYMTRPSSLVSLASSVSVSASPNPMGSNTSLSSGESNESLGSAGVPGVGPMPVGVPMTSTPSVPASTRGAVHVLWNVADVPFPTSLPPAYTIDRVHRIAESYGPIATFKAVCYSDLAGGDRVPGGVGPAAGVLTMPVKKCLHEHGVELEEVYRQAHTNSIDLAVMTNILRVAIVEVESQVQSQWQRGGSGGVSGSGGRPSTLILLASQEDFGRALHVLRRSTRFVDVIVIYHQPGVGTGGALLPTYAHEPVSLIRHATVSFEWSQLLAHGLPAHTSIAFDQARQFGVSPSLPVGPSSDRKEAHMRSASLKDLPSMVQSHRHVGSGSYSHLPSAVSSAYTSRSSTPSSARSSALPSVAGFTSIGNSRSSSISSFPTSESQGGTVVAAGSNTVAPAAAPSTGRSMMGAVLDVTPAFDANTTSLSELSVELRLERLAPKVRAMVLAFKSVLQYCEDERIIPRESVLKKRLLDTSIGIGTQMADVDFEQLLSLSVSCGIAAVEGTAPQRIIYPSSGPVVDGGGSIRKFECADFFQPMQRLTVLQTHELLAFLQRVKPEVDRGRFGFAQYLSLNAPTAITGLPHGVLVELVQLLLNQKILLFRKGRVSTNPNLAFADLHALASLSVASKPHTALLSTTKGAQGQQAAVQLKSVYTQMQSDIDAHNARKETDPAFTAPGQTATTKENPSDQQSQRDLPPQTSRPFSAPASPSWRPQCPSTVSTILAPEWSSSSLATMSDADPLLSASMSRVDAWDSATTRIDPRTSEMRNNNGETINATNTNWSTQTQRVANMTPPMRLRTYQSAPLSQLSDRPAAAISSLPTAPPAPRGLTCTQLFAHKFLQSKWGDVPHQMLAQHQRFPFVALWHSDLTMVPMPDAVPSVSSWSVTCTFDLSDELYTFSSVEPHAQLHDAIEALSRQMLGQTVRWKLAWSCMLQELKMRRRSILTAAAGRRRLPFLLRDAQEVAAVDRDETTISDRTSQSIHRKLSRHPVLYLDSILSSLSRPQMIYSCEKVDLTMPEGPRTAWSVAAALTDETDGAVSSLKEKKMDAKVECALKMLDKLRQVKPPAAVIIVPPPAVVPSAQSAPASSCGTPTSRTAMNPKAASWTPEVAARRMTSTHESIRSIMPKTDDEMKHRPVHDTAKVVGDEGAAAFEKSTEKSPDVDARLPSEEDDEEAHYQSEWDSFAHRVSDHLTA